MSRVVLVTGGTRGLGRGIATAFVEAGDDVVVCGRNALDGPGRFVAVRRARPRRGGRADRVDHGHRGTAGRRRQQRRRLAVRARVRRFSPRFAERIIALNLLAPLYVARAARAVMTTGVILNIGSVAAVRPAPGTAAYAAAKAGLTVLTRALALEWAPAVRVNQITVGLLETESSEHTYGDGVAVSATVPMGRMALPADVAAACVMLASESLSYVTGADLFVDGGGEIPAFHTALR